MSAPLPLIRVLVVDEASDSRQGWQAAFAPAQRSIDAQFARNRREAAAAMRRATQRGRPFDTIFLDLSSASGTATLGAARELVQLDPDADVVLCADVDDLDPDTLAVDDTTLERAFFLQKPFHPREIRQLARALAAKRATQDEVRRLAYFDSLTGLANRENFRSRVAADLRRAPDTASAAAVLFLDLNDFKRINDTLGHTVGDALLCQVATRLNAAVRDTDRVVQSHAGAAALQRDSRMLARQGGDEFIVYLAEITSRNDASVVAQRILERLAEPVQVNAHEITISPSIGIAMWPEDGTDIDELLKHADLAMYHAKRSRGEPFVFFDRSMSELSKRRSTLEAGLRRAIPEQQLRLVYQPLVDPGNDQTCCMEALLRWDLPGIGAIAPSEFLPIAESSGLMASIGSWVLDRACRDAASWLEAGLPLERVAVNLAGSQLFSSDLFSEIERTMAAARLQPGHLEVEITEATLLMDEAAARRAIEGLKRMGIAVTIDDFGSGYSNPAGLMELPVDRVKIDRRIVADLAATGRNAALARATIDMARALNLRIAAEGVEHERQFALLRAHQCREAQGYLVSQPLGAREAALFLRQLPQVTAIRRLRRLVAPADSAQP
ncbi:MAG: EAL domain-containing protein [Sinobacteraceae bacterium]|nr:EAL domain-containing protein [Nevskiaceae bacterium]